MTRPDQTDPVARSQPVDPIRRRLLRAAALAPVLAAPALAPALAGDKGRVIDLQVDIAIEQMQRSVPGANELLDRAKGVLVVPEVTEASFLVGGAYGEGALRVNGGTVAYYSLAKGSFGFQAGAQKFNQALFFMTTAALEKFRRSEGWELGAEAQVTAIDQGLMAQLDTTTAQNPVIALVYGQAGLMGGVNLGGAKFTRVSR